MNFIPHNIKTLRLHFNLTQDDLAIKIDTKRHNIAQWEIGRAYPSVENLLKLCKIFDIPIMDLISVEINEGYFAKAEEAPAIYFNHNSDSAKELVRFLQEQVKEQRETIKSLLEIINKEHQK